MEAARTIADLEVAPQGIVSQHTITAFGEILDKDRLTHDLSFRGAASGTSINSIVIDDSLTTCRFEHIHLRTIYCIVGCRNIHPFKRIWIPKIDWKSTYRRLRLLARSATKSATQAEIGGVSLPLINLRLTFGGRPNPSEWGNVSELAADLANDILKCKVQNPRTLHSPTQHIIPEASPLPDVVPLAQVAQTIVDIPAENDGKCDEYIDDSVIVGPDINDNEKRSESVILLALYTLCRPISPNEPILREYPVSLSKHKTKGGLSEVKTILGWQYNTRTLQIFFPTAKFQAWTQRIHTIL